MLHLTRGRRRLRARAGHPAAYEQAGGALQRLLGRRLDEIYPDRPDIQHDIAQSLAEHDTVRREMEHRLVTTGDVRRLDVSYVFVPPDGVMVHADDVTELRESEERLRAVIATLESGLLTVELGDESFADRVARTFKASGTAPGRLALEITRDDPDGGRRGDRRARSSSRRSGCGCTSTTSARATRA